MSLTRTQRLRQLLAGERALMAPGVVDAMYARLVAEAGFDAMYMTGAGTSATRLGFPDVGLLTMTEMVDNATRIADASDVPLIADADNGSAVLSMCGGQSSSMSAEAFVPFISRIRFCQSVAATLPESR